MTDEAPEHDHYITHAQALTGDERCAECGLPIEEWPELDLSFDEELSREQWAGWV